MMVVKTNNHPRELIYWEQLTSNEQKEMNLYDAMSPFFRYKGQVYCIDDFSKTDHFLGWDGYISDTFFSGILVRYPVEEWGEVVTDGIIVGRYFS